MCILFSNKLRPGPIGTLIRWLLFPVGVLFCFKDSDRVFLKVFFLSLTLNILTPLSFSFFPFLSFFLFFIFDIDSGVFFHCCQGRDTRGIGPWTSQNFVLCT